MAVELVPAPDTVWYGSTLVCAKGDMLTPEQFSAWFPASPEDFKHVVRTAIRPLAKRSSNPRG